MKKARWEPSLSRSTLLLPVQFLEHRTTYATHSTIPYRCLVSGKRGLEATCIAKPHAGSRNLEEYAENDPATGNLRET